MVECKIEMMGLGEDVLRMKSQGFGSKRISKRLSEVSGEAINASNVDNYIKSLTNMKGLMKKEASEVKGEIMKSQLKVIGNWKDIDTRMKELMDMTQGKLKPYVDKGESPPSGDLRLMLDMIMGIGKLTESRARLLGMMQGGIKVTINNIENQYNNLKAVVLEVLKDHPDVMKKIQDRLLESD